MRAKPGAHLRREADAVRVLAGAVRFEVAPQSKRLVIHVSHGAIEVLGTVFEVEQDPQEGGNVHLEEGRIRFVALNGETREMRAGESLRWPLPPSAQPPSRAPSASESAPKEPTSLGRPPSPVTLPGTHTALPDASPTSSPSRPGPATRRPEDTLMEIDALRIRRDYATLTTRLRELMAAETSEPMRRTLSLELADVLTEHGADAQACEHLTLHLRRYPQDASLTAVARARAKLSCDDGVR